MFINTNKTGQLCFHLQTKSTSYLMEVHEFGHLMNLYYGKRIEDSPYLGELYQNYALVVGSSTSYKENAPLTLDTVLLEYPGHGKGDYRLPAVQMNFENGSSVTDFIYDSHLIYEGKYNPDDLPHVFENGEPIETLEIILKEKIRDVYLHMYYSVVYDKDVIVRSSKLVNQSTQTINVTKMMSFNLDFNHADFELQTLDGMWIRERQINEGLIRPGIFTIDSKKGVSGANHNSFMCLKALNTTEDIGECYGFSLIYSGNFSANIEVSPYQMTRIQMGISDFEFSWPLEPGAFFDTPEAVMVYSDRGMNGMSQCFHNLINKHIVTKRWQNRERPILMNNWEATYFDFNEKKLLQLAKAAKKLGIELFVLDDGWFKGRNDDTTSLGDWVVDQKKLPSGLAGLSKKINKAGLEFGIWVEPEMVSVKSDLYLAHPEWAIQLEDRVPSYGRNQLMLDLSNPEAVDYLFESLFKVFDKANVTYVKWDMNRNLSDKYSSFLGADHQGEFSHRYVLGLYSLLKRLNTSFPDILFESCSSGGNRFDMGMIYYMPQTWTSDNLDAVERYEIQYGTSMVFPLSTMGAHVGGRPSQQVLRSTPIETRFNVAAFGLLGYELDLIKLTPFDQKVIVKQIAFYKENRMLLQYGQFFRHQSPFKNNQMTWSVVSENKEQFIAGYYQKLQRPCPPLESIKLKGLNSNLCYEVHSREQYQNIAAYGELINAFLPVEIRDGGILQSVINNRYLYKLESQTFKQNGDVFMHVGLRLYAQFAGTGINEQTRNIGDFGSRLYIGKAHHN